MLSKYFGGMTSGFTSNYFFEIDAGIVSMWHLVTTPEENVERVSLIGNGNPSTVRQAFIEDLFAAKSIDLAAMDDVRLECTPLLQLTLKKRKSLALKYDAIPAMYQSHFPSDDVDDARDQSEPKNSRKADCTGVQIAKRTKKAPG